MKKEILSLFTAAVMVAGMSTAMAENPEVNVVVNGAKVNFADQKAIIVNDRTLIPARGAFEAMGCTVEWDGEAREVEVRSSTNTKVATLTIDSDKMVVLTYTSLFDAAKEEITLDVPAQIMNDRTMIPLRAVGEAMGATVAWDGETYTASITTTDGEKLESQKESLTATQAPEATEVPETSDDTDSTDTTEVPEATEAPAAEFVSVSLSEAEAAVEDEVVVNVDLKGLELYPEHYVSAVTIVVEYDKSVLELSSASLVNGDTPIADSLGVENPDLSESSAKIVHVTIDEANAVKADGTVMKLTFKVLKDEACDISISSGYDTTIGYDTLIGLDSSDGHVVELYGTKLVIDETPLTVND